MRLGGDGRAWVPRSKRQARADEASVSRLRVAAKALGHGDATARDLLDAEREAHYDLESEHGRKVFGDLLATRKAMRALPDVDSDAIFTTTRGA